MTTSATSLQHLLADPRALLTELDRLDSEDSLAGFIRRAWHVIEPAQPYVHGWHVDAIADHLEAVTAGQITRLLINIPPGTMKSLAVGVFWPAWEWGPCNRPSTRVVATSHSLTDAVRDNLRARRLVTSEWYQALWGDRVKMTGDQNAKTKFENTATGFRECSAFTGTTGKRGDRVIIDDPLSVDDAGSDAVRESVNRTFREALPTRLNNPDRSAIVIVMQRLHERDVSGVALAGDYGYEHLMLPMEFEPERRCVTSLGVIDHRLVEGELLFPDRFPREVVERDKVPLGAYAVAGQFQQRPVPREGGMFKREWFAGRIVEQAPPGTVWVRHWDLAATASAKAARTAGVKLGRTPDGRFVVGHVALTQSEGNAVRMLVFGTAEVDGKAVEVSLPQDGGQAGKIQVQDYAAMLAGYKFHAEPERGDKAERALPFANQCEAGNVSIVRGDWNEGYLDELCLFPGGQFKDQVDASSAAFGRLVMQREAPVAASAGPYRVRR